MVFICDIVFMCHPVNDEFSVAMQTEQRLQYFKIILTAPASYHKQWRKSGEFSIYGFVFLI